MELDKAIKMATMPMPIPGLHQKFMQLASAHTNFCAGPGFIDSESDDAMLQGSCCSTMDFSRYKDQINGLKEFLSIPQVPTDPYDISVSSAKQLLSYDKDIILTTGQQSIYDEATKQANEHGPCCCKCWRWNAMEGLAKYLIRNQAFTATQIAKIWDLEDGCGGKDEQPSGMSVGT